MRLGALRFRRPVGERPARVRAIEHEVAHSLGVRDRVGDRDGRPLRDPQQGEPVQTGVVGHGAEVTDPRVEGVVVRVPIRQTAASLVVPDDAVALAE